MNVVAMKFLAKRCGHVKLMCLIKIGVTDYQEPDEVARGPNFCITVSFGQNSKRCRNFRISYVKSTRN